MTPTPDTADRAVVVRVIEAVERRLRRDRLVQELLLGFCASLAVPVSVAVWRLFLPLPSGTPTFLAVAWLVGFGAFAAWRISRKSSLARAAASVDAQADLEDELKSACWFASHPTASPWIDAHLHRAAQTAEGIDVDALYPRQVPQSSWTAVGLLVLLVLLNLVPTSWTRGWLAAESGDNVPSADARNVEDIAERLETLDIDDTSSLEQRATQLLQDLLEGIAIGDPMDQLHEVQALLDSGSFDLEDAEQSLDAMGEAFEGVQQLDKIREALANQDLAEAAEQLRELAENLDEATADAEDRRELQESLEDAARETSQDLEELSEALERSAEELEQENMEAAQEALEQAASELEELAQQQSQQELNDAARRQLQQLQESLSARDENASQQQQQSSEQANQEQAQGGSGQGEGDEQTTQQGGDEGEAQRPGEGQRQKGNEAAQGDQGGMPTEGPPEFGAPTELEVTLRQEVLDHQQRESELERERLVEQDTRAADSKVEYREIEPGPSYAEAEALEHEQVPWLYRHLIKDYFQAVGPRTKHD